MIDHKAVAHYSSLHPGRVAQSVEHLTFNQVVTGSNPVAPTTPHKGFQVFGDLGIFLLYIL